jgi:hypothetical protein
MKPPPAGKIEATSAAPELERLPFQAYQDVTGHEHFHPQLAGIKGKTNP